MSLAAGAPAGAPRRDSPLRFLRGVGPARAERLAALGLRTVEDLWFHLPLRYEDRRHVVAPSGIATPGKYAVRGRLAELRLIRTRKRGVSLLRGRLLDDRGALPVLWFNQPYLRQRWSDGDEVVAHGPVREVGVGGLELVNPTLQRAGEAVPGVVAVYPALGGFGPAAVGRLVAAALESLRHDPPSDPLPESLRRRYALPTLAVALAAIHAPAADADLAELERRQSPAHLRLIYGELLALQLGLADLRRREVSAPKSHRYRIDDRTRQIAREILPFRLTAAQKRVVREIADDLRRPEPMLRLLQGDVGSGKTIVAALAMLLAAESGLQAAFMAPTELLAEQQYAGLSRLLGARYRIELVTSSRRDAAVLKALAEGAVRIVVGTHALIQQGVRFHRLGLVVIDEQHRFGVEQRRLLQGKGERPDVLVMTATPIPRSLALTVYGDLELSLLDEMPPGRTPVATEVVPASARREVYRSLRAALAAGAQAYVVFPRIEEDEDAGTESVAELGAKLRDFLREVPSAVLHGQLPAAERERLHGEFAAGRLRLLVATTVIEVGIDVPGATWMVIEGAERFGLAQLHQLRGRVGRGAAPGRCVAIHGRPSEAARARLELFAAQRDGFALAEADLAMRGPGDLLGTRQAGVPRLKVADLVAHLQWIERARADAREILAASEVPEHARLLAEVRSRLPMREEAFAGG